MVSSLLFVSSVLLNIQDIQRVAIIDTGLNLNDERFKPFLCKDGHKDFTGNGIKDTNGHGTHIAGLIKQYAGNSNYCLIILKYFDETTSGTTNQKRFQKAISEAIRLKASIVNLSAGGPEYEAEEYRLLALNKHITFVTCAGNDGSNLDIPQNAYYPASYNLKNIIVVGALTRTGERYKSSNYGSIVTHWELGEYVYSTLPNNLNGHMSGTSMATAIRTGKLIYEKAH